MVDGVVYFHSEYSDKETSENIVNARFVDDRTINQPTLGRRRLKLKELGVRLYPIGKAIYFLGDLIKVANSTTWFIDSAGKYFQYKKSKLVKLTCHKIEKVLPTRGLGAVLELRGIPTRFKTAIKPSPEQQYAGILHLGHSLILYGVYYEEFKPSKRKV